MVTSKVLSPSNGAQDFVIIGGTIGSSQITVSFGAAPSAGTVSIATKEPGSTSWVTLKKATAVSITSGLLQVRADGVFDAVRVTFAGLVGGANPVAWVSQNEDPKGLYSGLAAITTQPYTEANVKNGVQFYLRASWPTADLIVQGTTRKLFFQTGAKPVIVKLRDFHYVSEEISITLFKTPVGVTGGVAVPIRNYNGVSPVASTVTATVNVTTSNDGAQFDGPEYFFGASNAAQRGAGSIPLGRERILPANSTFLVAITASAGIGNSRAQYFLDWYEGDTDVPL